MGAVVDARWRANSERPPDSREGAEAVARKRTVEPDPDDLRKDLLAAMAAARELGPEMDTAIVDAHLRRHYGEGALEAPRAVQPATPPPAPAPRAPSAMGPYLGAGLAVLPIVAVLIVAAVVGWHAFPFLFFLWPLFAWGAFGRRRMWRHYGGGYRYRGRWDGGQGYDRGDWRERRDDGITEVGYRGDTARGRVVSVGEIV
jgi:hypothetical protein